jgi:1,5-anhydro-D-fructose reductase (1,5-anhydro-D-mannitol-forming)
MQTIRWGIIGCGDVTEVKSGPGFQKAQGSALVAVMRRNAGLAEDYARRHSVPRWYSDADQLIADPEVNAVYVATPPSSHKQYALAAARAGKPVYVEKPMALNAAECDEMIEACRQAGVPLWVAYYRRAQPKFLAVRDLLAANEIGDVRFARILLQRVPVAAEADPVTRTWRFAPEVSGGGHLLDMGSHMLDLLDFFLGPVQTAQGIAVRQARMYPAEDSVVANLAFERGVLGVGVWNSASHAPADLIELVGDRGELRFACFDPSPIILIRDGLAREIATEHPTHVQQPLIQTIVDELNGTGQCPSTGESGARTTRVIDAILADYRTVWATPAA